MKQPQLIKDAFKKEKFKTGNQDRIKEAVRDCAKLCGMAAVCVPQIGQVTLEKLETTMICFIMHSLDEWSSVVKEMLPSSTMQECSCTMGLNLNHLKFQLHIC